jgi:hypothetical protein
MVASRRRTKAGKVQGCWSAEADGEFCKRRADDPFAEQWIAGDREGRLTLSIATPRRGRP